MNLIEQFGYEKVKDALDQLKREKKDLLTVGKTVLVRAEIEQNLLDYRRQHNIFEVGDFIFHPMFGALFEIKRFDEKYVVASTKWGYEEKLLIELISHANDKEIKAGKRLEVNDAS